MSTTSRHRMKSLAVIDKCQVEIVDLKGSYSRSAGSKWAAILDGTELCRVEEFAARHFRRDLENSRNAVVMTTQTVWLPMSSRPVSQQPSRKNPVIGFIEQISSRSPSTLRGVLGRPPPLPLVSLSIAVSARDATDQLLIFGELHAPHTLRRRAA